MRISITHDRLARRLDEAAGFMVPLVPRGLNQILPLPNVRDEVVTAYHGDAVRSNSDLVPPMPDSDYAVPVIDGVRTRYVLWRCPTLSRPRYRWAPPTPIPIPGSAGS